LTRAKGKRARQSAASGMAASSTVIAGRPTAKSKITMVRV
jgi:hypothetical protein